MKWLYFALFDHHIVNSEYTAGELRPVSVVIRSGAVFGSAPWEWTFAIFLQSIAHRLHGMDC